MKYHDTEYLNLVEYVLEKGVRKSNRTGKDTFSVFGHQMRFDLRDGTIPLLTTKKMFTRGVIREILWYLQGADNIDYLKQHNVTIWDEWAREDGSLGPVYGYQWRKWQSTVIKDPGVSYDIRHGDGSRTLTNAKVTITEIDQIAQLIDKLKTNPNDRRLLVSAWNVADLPEMALPPCHYSFQCYARPLTVSERIFQAGKRYHSSEIIENTTDASVEAWLDEALIPKYELSMLLNQRSCDVGLGVPFNIVQYSIILRMIAYVVNMVPGEFVWNGGDVHVYEDHVEQLKEQLTRSPYPSPKLSFARHVPNIDSFAYEDFIIEGYQSHPKIEMDVAV